MSQLKIGGYVRVSTEEQASLVDGSLDNQRYRINAYVDLKNVQEKHWGHVVEFYIDDGYSAKDTRRPAFQRMMEDVRKGKIDLVLVSDLSRLSRNISDFCGMLESFKKFEISFLSIKEQFDTSTSAGKMMLYNMINLAQFEREQIAERVSLGCHSRAMRGLLNGGHEILGYKKIPEKKNTYVVNHDEVGMVKTIFEKYLELGSLGKTIPVLDELGIKPKIKPNKQEKLIAKGIWTYQTLANVLRNPAYIGMWEVNKKNKNRDQKHLNTHQKYQMVKASWPPIVDEEIFLSVQRSLRENKLREHQRLANAERRVFLASGILCCSECGKRLVGQSAHGERSVHRYYIHSPSKGNEITCSIKRIRADEVEEALTKHLTKVLSKGNYKDSIIDKIYNQQKVDKTSVKSERNRLQGELALVQKEMESAFRMQMNSELGKETEKYLLDKMEDWGRRKLSLEKELSEAKEKESNVISLEDVRKEFNERYEMVSRGWAKLTAVQQKRVLKRLIQSMYISSKGIEIYYYNNISNNHKKTESPPEVIPYRAYRDLKLDSKLKVDNCMSSELVMPEGVEPSTYSLEGNCSIQLS